jgi:hypothetical protein
MILSLVDYLLFFSLVPFGFWIRFRVADSINARLIFFYCQAAAVTALGIGGSYSAALAGSAGAAVFFARVAAIAVVGTHLIVALLALSFPYEKQPRILRWMAIAVWLFVSYFILFTDRYLVGISFAAGSLVRDVGPFYNLIVITGFALGLVSAALLLIRRIFFKSVIYQLQTVVVVVGLAVGYVASFVFAVILPFRFDMSWTYTLLPVGGALLAAALGYGVTITRLFDLRAAVMTAASFSLYALTLGLIAGLLFSLLSLPVQGSAVLVGLIAAVVYFGATRLGVFFRGRYERLLRSRASYGERLEEGLSSIDFSQGRDPVIENFLTLLRDSVGCGAVNLLVENNSGELVNVGSTNGLTGEAGFERKAPGVDLLLNNDVSIILKTEIVTNYEYHDVKGELLAILERFDADALVLLREGRAIIGSVLLGAKLTGGDFTDYDYDTISRVYGKLFVVAYYLKNVAQESLVMTVDRELEFSEQIIQSIQENIDHIAHPAVDIAYMTRSTRKLGGDFIDFIRLSPDRFIFVIGDVSGKGLNASMSMVILKSVVRTFLKETKDFKKLVVKTNAFIKANLPRGTFFAGVFGLFDFKERSLYYVNSGVPIMLLLSSAYNNPVEIQGDGKVLGFVKDIAPYVLVRKATFKQGDILLVTTDGLTDAESVRGARFGKDRIQTSLLENRNASSERIVRYLSESVAEFVSQEMNDDITILAVKFT